MTRAPAAASQRAVPPTEVVEAGEVSAILDSHRGQPGELIAVLETLQDRYGYLSEEALRAVSDQTGCPLVDIYGIATFYRSFTLRPRGRHLVSACLGTACHVRGAQRVVEELKRQLGVGPAETTPDGEFTLETVNCLGACALGPVVVIDGHYFSKVRKSRVRSLLEKALAGFPPTGDGAETGSFPIEVRCPRCNHSLMDADFPIDAEPSIRCSVSFDRRHGWLRLSAIYGSTQSAAEPPIPPRTVVPLFCPHCHGQLIGKSACPECEAPMAPMMIVGGGVVQICTRRGCEGRMLDLT